jgi:hypothetical protein
MLDVDVRFAPGLRVHIRTPIRIHLTGFRGLSATLRVRVKCNGTIYDVPTLRRQGDYRLDDSAVDKRVRMTSEKR